jgi:uncharacterized damage-inducible protein DinB
MTSDAIEILLATNLWANRNILRACEKLTPEQFHRRFEMGPGSLHDTTTHMLSAFAGWGDLLAGRERRPPLNADGRQYTVPELLKLLEEIAAEFGRAAHDHPISETITAARGGKSYTFTRGGIITHVTTHGMHHRAQCLNMLRHVGVNPLPLSSVVEWMRDGEPK